LVECEYSNLSLRYLKAKDSLQHSLTTETSAKKPMKNLASIATREVLRLRDLNAMG